MIDTCSLSALYHSLYLPYITYCAEVWGNTYATHIECLVLLQKSNKVKTLDHISRIFYNLHILKVLDILELRIGIIMFNGYHGMHNSFSVSMNVFMQPDKITHLLKCLHVLIRKV